MKEITVEYLASQRLSETFPQRFWSKVDKRGPDECWPWLASTQTFGYGRIWSGKPFNRLVGAHVASFLLNRGQISDGLCVLHRCIAHPWCTNPNHLYTGTKKDNAQDRERQCRGIYTVRKDVDSRAFKMTAVKVTALRSLFDGGLINFAELGRCFHITDVAARLIALRKSWKHIA
jgi:hypothetical protein